MERQLLIASVASLTAATFSSEAAPPRQEGTMVLPKAGAEGKRDLKVLEALFSKSIRVQPFGKKWDEIIPKAAFPKNRSGLGKAKTHSHLKFDPMELQEQSQYISNLGVEERYGWISLRLRRVFRYGRLLAMQIVIEPIGESKNHKKEFEKDLTALKTAWVEPLSALGLFKNYILAINELKSQPTAQSWILELAPEGRSSK